MSELYNKEYYEQYDVGVDKVNYADSEYTKGFLEKIADHIANDLRPVTVLDAGCAMGHLVCALRDRGIEAYGIDISEYAISQVREDIRPYCVAGSLVDPLPEILPRQFDLVTNIEVLEHLYAEDGKRAIENLCKITDCIIFCSTPDDFTDRTHFNVQQREYWARLFASAGFYDDLNYRPTYLTSYAVCYRRKSDFLRQIEDYERNIRMTEEKLDVLEESNRKLTDPAQIYKVYFDCGSGLTEENSFQAEVKNNSHFQQRIVLPKGCISVRFDPVEGMGCLVYNLQIRTENTFLQIKAHNGVQLNDVYIFRTTDPQIYIEELLPGSQFLNIDAEIIPMDQGGWIRLAHEIEFLEQQQGALKSAVEDKERHILHQDSLMAQREADYRSELSERETAYRTELAQREATYQTELAQRDKAYQAELAEQKAAYQTELAERDAAYQSELAELETAHQAELADREATYQTDRTERDAAHQVELAELANTKAEISQELEHYKAHYLAALHQREELKGALAEAQNAYNVISNAAFWKITKPFRAVLDFIKRLLRSNQYTRLFCKGLKCLKENGIRYTWRKVRDKLHHRQDFLTGAIRPLYTREELEAQRAYTFSRTIRISIVVPLYNTPKEFLHEMIQSVLDQTYGGWELCMADGSDQEHAYVGRICVEYAKKDSRICYQKLKENRGISENTNACIDISTGDYIGLLDHDDLLHPAALYDVMKAICDKGADFVYTDEATFESPKVDRIVTAHFKPDFAIDNLRANNYICHFSVFSKALLMRSGKFRSAYDGSQDHDIMLRLTAAAERIVHIPKLLYFWRSHPQSVSLDITSKEYAITAGKNAVRDSIASFGDIAEVSSSRAFPTIYRIRYEIRHHSKVSIIIPNKNHYADLKQCVESILGRSTYDNYEIVIIDNGSEDANIISYYDVIQRDPRIRVYNLDIEFNYARLNNFGAKKATGEYYILLNNDTEVITPEWIEELLMYVQRDDVAAAGAMLYYPDNTIQHAGIILGLGTDRVAGHPFHRVPRGEIGYMGRLCYAQDLSAVTAACMMVKSSAYWEVGGFNDEFKVAYNDVDFCMKLREAGYRIVWTPYAELYHYESRTRGYEDTPEKQVRFQAEVSRFKARWSKELAEGDPYYNPNLTLDRGDFSLR